MEQNNLNRTKNRLTIIFTILIFCVVVFLGFMSLSVKYYNHIVREEANFTNMTISIEKKFVYLNDFIKDFDIVARVFKIKQNINRLNDAPPRNDFLNVLVFDNKTNTIIFSNILDRINLNLVENVFFRGEYDEIEQYEGFLVKKIRVVDAGKSYDILFFKNLQYSFVNYITDLLGFIIMSILFSIVFYYMGYVFVNKNLAPVEQNLKDMHDFIHNAGHELKTPIAVMYSNLQLLNELGKYDKELTDESIKEIKRLDNLIEGLVELSDINSISKVSSIDLKDEIYLVVKDFSLKAEDKNIKINFKAVNNFILKANKEYFYIFFSNILGNAIKYTNNGENIEVELDKNKLFIKDAGIGIDKEDIGKIFDRFFKADKSRNQEGFGIGLSLVKKIADIYKWKIRVESELGKGTKFKIVF